MAALAFTSSGLSSLAVAGAGRLRLGTSRRSFLRIPAAHAAAPAPAPAPLRCIHNHADFVAPLSKVHVPAASDAMKVHVPAASGTMAADDVNVHGPAASGTMAADDVNVHGPAAAAVKDMIAGLFRPLLDNFHQLRSLSTVLDTDDYHIGMPYGALVASVACYRLWKMDPSMFLDAVLGYAFYKLSVVSSQVRRQGFSNDIIARIKFGLLLIWAVKDFHRAIPLAYITYTVWYLYLTTFVFDMVGLKKGVRAEFTSMPEKMETPTAGRLHQRSNVGAIGVATSPGQPPSQVVDVDECAEGSPQQSRAVGVGEKVVPAVVLGVPLPLGVAPIPTRRREHC